MEAMINDESTKTELPTQNGQRLKQTGGGGLTQLLNHLTRTQTSTFNTAKAHP